MVNQSMLHCLLIVVLHSLPMFVVLLSTPIYATKTSNGLILELIHADSPKSPLYRANLTDNERMKMYIEMSTARVKSFRRSHVRSLSPDEGLIRPKVRMQAFAYLVQVGIGTFMDEFPTSRTYYLQLDTGSQVSWTQCEGCINCFKQADPYFPASRSSTYQPFPCSHCPPDTICQDSKCVFDIEYVDGTKILAIAALEVFTFESQGESSHPIKNMIFGCGFDMHNFEEGETPNNKISGIMGMSNDVYGFMKQTKLMFNGKFSYCLKRIFTRGSSPMYLRFGNDVLPQPIQLQSTPIFKYGDHGSYYLHLQGISVGDQRLQIHPDTFAFKSNDGSGGCVIDSGSAISWIVTEAYKVFKDAIISFIKDSNKDNWRKMRKHGEEYDLCYQRYKLPKNIHLPVITFHFENNANFVIAVEESFYLGGISSKGRDIVCLQFLESTIDNNDGVTFLGSTQQANKRIVYDLEGSLLHFGHADCSNDN